MKKDFWLERWERQETGFHQDEFNPYLHQYWRDLHLARDSQVFVPLCGNSRSMRDENEPDHATDNKNHCGGNYNLLQNIHIFLFIMRAAAE